MKSCTVEIRKNDTGEVRLIHEIAWHGVYVWVEGNFSCDCDRSLLFGDKEDCCGFDKYSVRITADSGKKLYQEFDE